MTAPRVRVGDVLRLERKRITIDPAGQYEAIGVKSFGNGLIRYASAAGAELSKMTYSKVPPNSLVVSNIKAWEGAAAVSTLEDSDRVASNRFLTYIPSKVADLRFIWHYLISDRGVYQLSKASPGSADRNRTLGKTAFENLEIPLPSLTKQRTISDHLDRITAVAAGCIRNKYGDRRGTALREQIVSRAYTCAHLAIGSLLKLDRTWIDVNPNAIYSAIGVRGFGRGLIRYQAVTGAELSKLRYYSVTPNRLIVSNIKAWEGAVAVAPPIDESLVASNRFLSYQVASPHLRLGYLNSILLSIYGIAMLQRASPGSADRNRTLSINSFESIKIPVPPLDVQVEIEHRLATIDGVEELSRHQDQLAKALPRAARNEAFASL